LESAGTQFSLRNVVKLLAPFNARTSETEWFGGSVVYRRHEIRTLVLEETHNEFLVPEITTETSPGYQLLCLTKNTYYKT